MQKRLALGALVGSLWAALTPWIPLAQAGSPAGHMMTGMGNAATPAMGTDGGSQVFGVTLSESIYYWHIVPGIAGIVVAMCLLLATSATLRRISAVSLIAIGLWVALGPWVLPSFGLGESMTMGLTVGSLLRHAAPGALILVAAIAGLRTLARSTPAAAGASAVVSAGSR